MISKHCAIIGNNKLDKHSYLVEYTWQAQSLDLLMYPKSVGQDPYPLTV